MAYSKEIIRKARERLAQAKADRESENQAHLIQAYQQQPRLKQIDLQLRRTMAAAAQAAFTKGIDVQTVMEQVKQENLALQQERARLVQLHFEEGFLDDSPVCDKCGGSGYIGTAMCECLQELCRQEQKKELTLLSGNKEGFNQFRLEYYSVQYDPKYGTSPRTIMEKTLSICRSYAAFFSRSSENLLFSGNPGLGKTFLAACISRVVADRGFSVAYESAARLFSNLERAKFSSDADARREAEKYAACDLLIVDDLGTEMGSQFVTAALYSLLNDRLLEGRPTIISTNLSTEELSGQYSLQIASRLRGNFRRVAFVGEDIRVLKNRGL